ncbi:alpha-amylase family protein [Entamoeba histolytica HM-1:IMSS-B]|uniref:Alpha-amylase family protein n=6 Tax=Entamoeba histolytica TaxID=5759 RepID=C4M7A7_ENTH1|nr:alpha-amylase family protein [Entamoeba histolytica HM-1:IMSS]EMD47316.1 glucan 1,6alpha-glucosidase, putative [Entamoeba histolytica KU27]EMH75266.1 alpha-amylase family protein [Entamoeba histolytica HM-1:IMSS-B]EMS17294.1 glucan 1,6-alpha-glucosidase [Entamoeba histolytica HM-3:IMSS]ENY64074.1 glucan 1,6-alpha-glucosidase, putative [Entamoeba histolytica HM-1:IMSS-A]GAT97406.1 alpha-amylase family protein [Entamoeba histolytica]|eukprot:XP_652044.1 alpha-amylase family protein [Entamoeba histolytica HM-1:IMSS]
MISLYHPFYYGNIYHILVDRFSGENQSLETKENSNQFLGGTLKGITSRMNYLKELGCSTIFLSPIYKNHAIVTEYMPYHGYHIIDFNDVDPRFGTKNDFKQLCKVAHQNNISILLDIVPNHVSCYHPWVEEAMKGIRTERFRWYPDGNPMHFLGYNELWKVNHNDTEVKQSLLNAFVEFYELGADDFRIDHAIGIPNSFFKEVRKVLQEKAKELKRRVPLLIGEVWFGGCERRILQTIETPMKGLLWWLSKIGFDGICQELAQMMYIPILDGVLDIRGCMLIREYLSGKGRFKYVPEFLFKFLLWLRKWLYPRNFLGGLFVDNHDMDRIMFMMNGDINKVKHALNFISSDDGPMYIYYGTEVGMSQVASKETIGDIAMRAPMMWSLIELPKPPELFDFIQTTWKERKNRAKKFIKEKDE